MFEKLLFPLDTTRQAMETASKVLGFAQKHDTSLIVLSVVQSEGRLQNNTDALCSLLNKACEHFEQGGIQCDLVERTGKPAFVICDVADELNVDLIVMGTRGINLEVDSESTAVRVIQLAPCPVLVIP